jgi:hypothetical protein
LGKGTRVAEVDPGTGLVSGIDVDDERIRVEHYKDEIKGAPEFDEERRGDPAYRDALTRHYGPAQPKA